MNVVSAPSVVAAPGTGRATGLSYVAGRPSVTDGDQAAVDAVLRSGWIGCGPQVAAFEADLSAYCSGGEAVVVSSATAALTLTLVALGVHPGDEVVTSALTFAATANAIAAVGATPILVDTLADGSTLDPDQVRSAAGPLLAAVVPVAWRGEPSDTMTLRDVCTQIAAVSGRAVAIVEDGAYALGSYRDDARACSPVTPVVVSFHPTKIITAGLGGAVLGLDATTAAWVRRARNQGLDTPAIARLHGGGYTLRSRGFAFEMSDIHAALGRSQLHRLDEIIERRRAVFEVFRRCLAGAELRCPSAGTVRFGTSNASLFAILLDETIDRDAVRRNLVDVGIGTSVQYPFLPDMPAWRHVRAVSDLAHSRRIAAATLSLPSSPELGDDDCRQIADAVCVAISASRRTCGL